MRETLNNALKESLRAKDSRGTSTLRLILAALKDRDIAARAKGNAEGISDEEITAMLQSMVKQRKESIDMYEKGGRLELAEGERGEIEVIQRFLPKQLSDEEIKAAVTKVIEELGASSLKEMGAVMSELRTRHAGCMDFGKASPMVKELLG